MVKFRKVRQSVSQTAGLIKGACWWLGGAVGCRVWRGVGAPVGSGSGWLAAGEVVTSVAAKVDALTDGPSSWPGQQQQWRHAVEPFAYTSSSSSHLKRQTCRAAVALLGAAVGGRTPWNSSCSCITADELLLFRPAHCFAHTTLHTCTNRHRLCVMTGTTRCTTTTCPFGASLERCERGDWLCSCVQLKL